VALPLHALEAPLFGYSPRRQAVVEQSDSETAGQPMRFLAS